MFLIWENIILFWQECSSRVDKVNAGQLVLTGDFLCTQMLLHCDGVVRATLVSKVVGNDHALGAVNLSNTCDEVARWDILIETG